MSAVLPEFYLTSISELNVEVPQPVVANQEPEAKKSSSSSSSGSESSLKIGEGICLDCISFKYSRLMAF